MINFLILMIIKKQNIFFPIEVISILIIVISFIGIFYFNIYWLLILIPLSFFPYRKLDGIKLIDNKIIENYKYIWFRKIPINQKEIPPNIKNILLVKIGFLVRTFSSSHGGGLSYKHETDRFEIFFYLNNKSKIKINHPILNNSVDAYKVTEYLAKKLNLKIYHGYERRFDLQEIDLQEFDKTGKAPSTNLRMLTKLEK